MTKIFNWQNEFYNQKKEVLFQENFLLNYFKSYGFVFLFFGVLFFIGAITDYSNTLTYEWRYFLMLERFILFLSCNYVYFKIKKADKYSHKLEVYSFLIMAQISILIFVISTISPMRTGFSIMVATFSLIYYVFIPSQLLSKLFAVFLLLVAYFMHYELYMKYSMESFINNILVYTAVNLSGIFYVLKNNKVSRKMYLANYKLVEANRDKSQLLSIISHDLKFPLDEILKNTHEIITCEGCQLSSGVLARVRSIEKSINGMNNIVETLIKSSRVKKIKNKKNFDEMINLETILIDTFDLVRGMTDTRAISIINNASGIKLKGNYDSIHTLIRNILINVIKLTYSGGLISIWSEVSEFEYFLHFSSRNTGISDNIIKNMKKSFLNAQALEDENVSIHGRSFIFCNYLAKMNSGYVKCELDEDKNLVFSFIFPLIKDNISHLSSL